MQTSVNQGHGPHRRPVGGARNTVSSETQGRWAWPSVARYASGAERSFLGLAHRRSLARSAASLSSLPNLSSSLPAVAAVRVAHSAAAETGGRHAIAREAGPERIVHRCHLQFGEKRALAVGPTRRGKGSKIMAISDGHGLPLAVHVASASPHETKLVEPTLQRRFLAETPDSLIGDRAYDSDPLDAQIRERFGVELVAPHNSTRSRWPPKMGACCAATVGGGKLSVCSPGFGRIFVVWSFAGNTTQEFPRDGAVRFAIILLRYL